MCENFSLTWSTLGRWREGSLVWVRVDRETLPPRLMWVSPRGPAR